MNGTIGTIGGRKLAGRTPRVVAILLLLLSLVGTLPAGPAYAKSAFAMVAVDPECAPAPASGQIVYGCDELSLNVQAARLWLNANKKGQSNNTLYTAANRGTSTYGMAQLDNGLFILGYSDGGGHAEARLLAQLRGEARLVVWDPASGTVKDMDPLDPQSVKAVQLFIEAQPCNTKPNNCEQTLKDAGLLDKTRWSWPWNAKEDATTAEKKALRDRTNDRNTGLKPTAIRQLFTNGRPGRIPDQEGQSGAAAAIERQNAAINCTDPAGPAASAPRASAGCPGGIDFTSIQLRYVSDGGAGGNTYSFRAPTTPGKPSTDGADAILDGFEALNVWMMVDPSKFWVNLNPGEPDRIIDANLAVTDVGHVMLQSDLTLKEQGTKLLDPNTAVGKTFWDRMDAAGLDRFCIRDWIVPKPATVRESGSELYILDAPLDVKSEGDSFQLPGNGQDTCPADSKPAAQIYHDVILPELVKVVNEAPEFTDLRRVYISRVAAEWYRQRVINDGRAEEFGIDSNDTSSLESVVPWDPKAIFDQYVKEINATRYTTPDGREIITGGVDLTQPVPIQTVDDNTFKQTYPTLPTVVQDSVKTVTKTTDEKQAFAGGADKMPLLTTPPASPPTTPVAAGGGSLPVTGTPIVPLAAVAALLLAIGLVALWLARRAPARAGKE